MESNKLVLNNLEQTVYMYVVNVASLLKTLQKAGVADENTIKLAKNAGEIHKTIIELTDMEFPEISNLNSTLDEINSIQDILSTCFENINRQVIHEKADLMIDTNNLKKIIISLLENK
ncbi:MAG: hypothetical protein JXL97_18660 [Bacteroidales bacterium]|nr:hypothetical protein [Bacteroidales bacterium]